MSALSSILRSVEGGKVAFWCPGCQLSHHVGVAAPASLVWGYNGDPNRPTFTPSVLVTYNGPDAGVDGAPQAVCHSFVTDGSIQFLSDCAHAMAGQSVPLPEWPA